MPQGISWSPQQLQWLFNMMGMPSMPGPGNAAGSQADGGGGGASPTAGVPYLGQRLEPFFTGQPFTPGQLSPNPDISRSTTDPGMWLQDTFAPIAQGVPAGTGQVPTFANEPPQDATTPVSQANIDWGNQLIEDQSAQDVQGIMDRFSQNVLKAGLIGGPGVNPNYPQLRPGETSYDPNTGVDPNIETTPIPGADQPLNVPNPGTDVPPGTFPDPNVQMVTANTAGAMPDQYLPGQVGPPMMFPGDPSGAGLAPPTAFYQPQFPGDPSGAGLAPATAFNQPPFINDPSGAGLPSDFFAPPDVAPPGYDPNTYAGITDPLGSGTPTVPLIGGQPPAYDPGSVLMNTADLAPTDPGSAPPVADTAGGTPPMDVPLVPPPGMSGGDVISPGAVAGTVLDARDQAGLTNMEQFPGSGVGQFFRDTAGNIVDGAGNIVRAAGSFLGNLGQNIAGSIPTNWGGFGQPMGFFGIPDQLPIGEFGAPGTINDIGAGQGTVANIGITPDDINASLSTPGGPQVTTVGAQSVQAPSGGMPVTGGSAGNLGNFGSILANEQLMHLLKFGQIPLDAFGRPSGTWTPQSADYWRNVFQQRGYVYFPSQGGPDSKQGGHIPGGGQQGGEAPPTKGA